MRKPIILIALVLAGTAAQAQLRVPFINRQPAQPVLQGIDALRIEFATQSGGSTVYFGTDSTVRR